MRAIQIRCPNCGASLDVQATALTITCSYCQTQSRVRPRTGFFEAPMKLPNQPQLARLPIAIQQHTRRWLVSFIVGMFFFVGMMAIIPIVIVNKVRRATSGATSHNGATGRTLNWSSDNPLIGDVNGDGVGDLLGRLRGLDGTDSIHLVAFDGATGKKLWQSPLLGTYQQTYQGTVALLGPQLLFVNDRGLARGFSINDGAERWKININEKLESACSHDGTVYLVSADKRWIKLDLDAGKAAEARPPPACSRLATDGRGQPTGLTEVDSFNRQVPVPSQLDGMYLNKNLIVEGNTRLALGNKQPGTAVPMVARYVVENFEPLSDAEVEEPTGEMSAKKKRELTREKWRRESELRDRISKATFKPIWKVEVPSTDPLGAGTSRLEHIGLSVEADCVVIPYEVRDKPIHLACVSWKTGEHHWDVVMPKAFIDRIQGITVSGKRAFFGMSSRVHAIDLATGKILFTVGQTH